MSLALRPTLPAVLKRAQQVLATSVEAASGVAVLWQAIAEPASTLARRTDQARERLPHSRLLLVVCMVGELAPRAGVSTVYRYGGDRTLKAIKLALSRPIPLRPGSLRGDRAQDPNRGDSNA